MVRGGQKREVGLILDEIRANVELGDGPVLSVCVGEQQADETFIEAVYRISEVGRLPYSKVQVSQAAAYLYAVGVDLVPETSDGQAMNHHHVVFQEPLESAQIMAYIRCFDEPIPNPTGGFRKAGRR